MNEFDLYDISEKYIELVNPTTPEKIVRIGEIMGLNKDSKVIEFGSGYGEVLALWAKHFGISGVGIEIRENAVKRARKKMKERGLENQIEIVHENGAEYKFKKNHFDVAACVGASFIWGGYARTIKALKKAVRKDGKLVVGEPYWNKEQIPTEYMKREKTVNTEMEILQITRDSGYDIGYLERASHDDWDRYESDNWIGLINWLKENPGHPEKGKVIKRLHQSQDEYFKYGREYLGWAIFVLTRSSY
ncbi:MAG: SAM-dependent methyltransferase [Vulcanimicrobiota bacterium]